MSTNKMASIKSELELEALRNDFLRQFRKYKIETIDHSKKSTIDKPMINHKDEEKEGFNEYTTKGKYVWEQQMYADVSQMENTIKIKGTDLETQLNAFEQRLISKSAKKHISRKCHHPNCARTAPSSYPNNLYLCDIHKQPLYKRLESYKIPVDKGTADEQKKCKKLNDCHQKVINSLKISDSQQSFGNNQHKYPPNYFTVCMSKLLLCQQELSKPLSYSISHSDQALIDSRRKMKDIVKKLMDLLIIARQNLNCHWCQVIGLIISQCDAIGAGIAWMERNRAYIAVLYAFLGDFISAIVGFIFAAYNNDRDAAFVAGAAAVGTGVGVAWGATETGVMLGTLVGGPAGALVGGLCGALIGGGLAAMYKYG